VNLKQKLYLCPNLKCAQSPHYYKSVEFRWSCYICGHINKIKAGKDIKKNFCKLFKEFELDFHIHLHLENNVLFPKTLLLERKILKKFTQIKLINQITKNEKH